MAGGPNAQRVACSTCLIEDGELTLAERTYEGVEDDHYRCARGHGFGIDWSHSGPPRSPAWPPSEDDVRMVAELRRQLGRTPT